MTIPTFTDDDISNAGIWTHEGTPDFVDDLHNAGTAIAGDKVDNAASNTSGFATSSGSVHSAACWFKVDSKDLDRPFICMRDNDSGGQKCFELEIRGATGGITARWDSDAGANGITSISSDTFDDGEWHHLVSTIDGNTCDIFVDGVEVAYSFDSFVTGTGFVTSGINYTGTLDLTLCAYSPQTTVGARRFFDGDVARPRLWQGTAIDAAAEFAAEMALLGGPTGNPLFPSAGLFKDSSGGNPEEILLYTDPRMFLDKDIRTV